MYSYANRSKLRLHEVELLLYYSGLNGLDLPSMSLHRCMEVINPKNIKRIIIIIKKSFFQCVMWLIWEQKWGERDRQSYIHVWERESKRIRDRQTSSEQECNNIRMLLNTLSCWYKQTWHVCFIQLTQIWMLCFHN